MSATPSTMIPLGTIAPDFTLADVVTGEKRSLGELRGEKGTLVMFICNHCPYVVHVLDEILRLAHEFIPKGIGVVAISSNDPVRYPADSPARMKELAIERTFPFPYLYDETQDVAREYNAACTPDFYLFDAGLRCRYRGQLDGARPGNDLPVDGRDLRAAINAVLEERDVDPIQRPSIGCNIKWRS